MTYRFGSFLLLFTLIIGTAVPAFAAGGKFYVPVNRSEIVTSPVTMAEVIVANPEIADIYVHGNDKLSIIGKQLGETSVRLFDEKNNLIRDINVMVTYDLPSIRKALHEFLPYERVGVEMINTKIALTGEISSMSAANTAMQIASQYIVPSRAPNDIQLQEGSERDGPYPGIINLMSMTAGQQVMLRIRVGEIQRSALKNLGVSLDVVKSSGNLPFEIATGGFLTGGRSFLGPLFSGNEAQGDVNFSPDSRGVGIGAWRNSSGTTGIGAAIEALEQDGLFKTLAEPNLVSLSGEEAEFLAGGEFPIPVSQGDNGIAVDYKPFGVSVRFTPFVLSENRIRIQVMPEVSEVSNAGSVQIATGVSVPAFNVRRASTTVELAPGESFMIAGLIQDSMQSTIEQLPGIGEVPILSSLFRSTSYQRQETELILAVTPYIVDPLKSSDIRLPSDDFRPASFMESVFYGALGTLNGDAQRISQTPSLEGPIGFMVD